jgi:hypothetical protein
MILFLWLSMGKPPLCACGNACGWIFHKCDMSVSWILWRVLLSWAKAVHISWSSYYLCLSLVQFVSEFWNCNLNFEGCGISVCGFRCLPVVRMGVVQMGAEMQHQCLVEVAMLQVPMLLRRKDPWMQACTMWMAIPLLMPMSMTILMEVRISHTNNSVPKWESLTLMSQQQQQTGFCSCIGFLFDNCMGWWWWWWLYTYPYCTL